MATGSCEADRGLCSPRAAQPCRQFDQAAKQTRIARGVQPPRRHSPTASGFLGRARGWSRRQRCQRLAKRGHERTGSWPPTSNGSKAALRTPRETLHGSPGRQSSKPSLARGRSPEPACTAQRRWRRMGSHEGLALPVVASGPSFDHPVLSGGAISVGRGVQNQARETRLAEAVASVPDRRVPFARCRPRKTRRCASWSGRTASRRCRTASGRASGTGPPKRPTTPGSGRGCAGARSPEQGGSRVPAHRPVRAAETPHERLVGVSCSRHRALDPTP